MYTSANLLRAACQIWHQSDCPRLSYSAENIFQYGGRPSHWL